MYFYLFLHNEKILIEASFGFAAEVPIDHRLRNPDLGGGAILDIGCYPLTICKLIAGHLQGLPFAEPREFSATGELDETGVYLQSHAHIIFSDSTRNLVHSLKINPYLVFGNGQLLPE